ncbi:MAG TPA: protein-methionine-sulfoxide reductase catalytic subunit MsrP [Blastocatellia bacterium]|nr:protein-methionine-sulfoxide reductase catalytic subunit MsrP [Blastocatellia bacterium]
MLIRKPDDIKFAEVTDESLYFNRRTFIRGAVLAATTTATGLLYRALSSTSKQAPAEGDTANTIAGEYRALAPGDEQPTSFEDITNYNNFYEFSTDKRAVAAEARNFVTRPWTVSVEGLVHKPRVFDLDGLLKISPPEERIYRLRCVEGWSMVIPWLGFPLAQLLKQVEPQSQARYVKFVTLADPSQMPNLGSDLLDWPYVEGLRLDEAMHPLTILSHGLYGKPLLPQNGAPLRLVVPWKYGFKSIKSIITIRLVEDMPKTTWNAYAPHEYGFYSNVNPHVDHPRWSQATERRIGEFGRRDTLLFNGYAEQVAGLYSGMDLKVYF